MKVVLDTNVFVSGVFFTGPPHRILEAWRDRRIHLFTSPAILEEYADVGERLRQQHTSVDVTPVLALVVLNSTIVQAPPLPERVCTDPDDDMFLACALAGHCKTIVSGDRHLLDVSGYEGIQVLRPRAFVDLHL